MNEILWDTAYNQPQTLNLFTLAWCLSPPSSCFTPHWPHTPSLPLDTSSASVLCKTISYNLKSSFNSWHCNRFSSGNIWVNRKLLREIIMLMERILNHREELCFNFDWKIWLKIATGATAVENNSILISRISMETASMGGLAGFQYVSPNHIVKTSLQ